VFGEKHFDYLIFEYVEHYYIERPHQAMGNVPLNGEWREPENDPPDSIPIECRTSARNTAALPVDSGLKQIFLQ